MADFEDKLFQLSTRFTDMSFNTVKEIVLAMVKNKHSISHGEQSMEKLNLQNTELQSVDMSDKDIQAFKAQLNKYSVDFHAMKNPETGLHTVFFKARDIDRVHKGLENCVKDLKLDKESKRPIKEAIKEAQERTSEKGEQSRGVPHRQKTIGEER